MCQSPQYQSNAKDSLQSKLSGMQYIQKTLLVNQKVSDNISVKYMSPS
jgi:hypothetical protein